MSLDVYLKMPETKIANNGSGIFIRENGQTKEISREEWDARYPDRDPVVCNQDEETDRVYHGNVTHNLGKMAGEAGIYECLWRPDETGITKAVQLIEPLTKGLALLKSDAGRFEALNPENGWGSYSGFLPFVEGYLEACKQYPDADVSVWR